MGAAALLPATAAHAQEPQDELPHPQSQPPAAEHVEHDLEGPLTHQQNAQRQAAMQKLASGEKPQARNGSKVMKLGHKKYVEMEQVKTDKIFTILLEFGDQVDPRFGGTPGPLHNQIAEPDRSKDNTTLWMEDFDREHFTDVYFGDGANSVKTYFETQSSGKYTVDGEVSDWVKVDYNEARYGNNACGSNVCNTVWDAVRDGVNQWTEDQKAAGQTTEQIRERLAEYDVWDRYDHDGDGDFNEPDGYLDHFQFVHAGEDESAGGGAQGTDAIWAHRWYAYGTDYGKSGPEFNKAGGTEIGDTGIWVGDYTVQPENGGLGVFAHEYAHDLGLPDLYDTSGTGESSVAYWSLMSSGSWLGKGEDAIGDWAGEMTAWDKLMLGWLDYDTAKAASRSMHTLAPQGDEPGSNKKRKGKQAVIVELPDKELTTTVVKPAAGEMQWWSASGDDLRNSLTRSVDLTGASTASLDLKGWWEIEAGYDYLYTQVSTDGGATWNALDGTADGEPISRDGSGTPALDGASGGYVDLSYDLSAYAGQQVDLRFHYRTDGGVAEMGFAADEITITADGETVLQDGAEDGDAGWTAEGFERIGESFTKTYPQYYIVENRQYTGYDKTLKTGPYNFGDTATRPDWVEHFPYQNGMLVWLWDTSQLDNNVGVHPGEGLVLPVDAHAKPEKWSDGSLMRNRIQAYDSPFSWYPSRGFTLHQMGEPTKISGNLPKPFFDDRLGTYWYESNPTGGVKVPDTNTRITIVSEPPNGKTMKITVGTSKWW
ncbi:immune inhibitor A domain-containing protein [Streptomyces sp. TRM 70351]|uniref:immune inhibitor A domain-containing protein n=1 Tax=Streptomyces sp. TRM 70351 TaxID=3116552 RepID=UPI002E7B5759|nr:immune inhibitor A domain-containing protein [Streptomyces sp. TRM 70351]MEE1928120.1 immune inhibitor A domain-containing protein [Streptomyces sp. TRM 70351]